MARRGTSRKQGVDRQVSQAAKSCRDLVGKNSEAEVLLLHNILTDHKRRPWTPKKVDEGAVALATVAASGFNFGHISCWTAQVAVGARMGGHKPTALHAAAGAEEVETARILLERGEAVR